MKFGAYARRAKLTDRTEDPDKGLHIALHGRLARPAQVSKAKKWFSEGQPLMRRMWVPSLFASRVGALLDCDPAQHPSTGG